MFIIVCKATKNVVNLTSVVVCTVRSLLRSNELLPLSLHSLTLSERGITGTALSSSSALAKHRSNVSKLTNGRTPSCTATKASSGMCLSPLSTEKKRSRPPSAITCGIFTAKRRQMLCQSSMCSAGSTTTIFISREYE